MENLKDLIKLECDLDISFSHVKDDEIGDTEELMKHQDVNIKSDIIIKQECNDDIKEELICKQENDIEEDKVANETTADKDNTEHCQQSSTADENYMEQFQKPSTSSSYLVDLKSSSKCGKSYQ